MRMFVIRVILLCLTMTMMTSAFGQAEPEVTTEPIDAPAPTPPEDPQAFYQTAKDTWLISLNQTPALVPLQDTLDPKASEEEVIGSRLKALESKLFSNREWRAYWELQESSAGALATSMGYLNPKELKKLDPTGARARGLQTWSELAKDKVDNQDSFYAAIQLEKDGLEARLELLLEREDQTIERPAFTDNPNEYEERLDRVAELEYLISIQKQKQGIIKEAQAFLGREQEGATSLKKALKKDLAMAERELAISNAQLKVPARDGLLPTWRGLAAAAKAKVAGMEQQVSQLALRQRVLVVEGTMLESEAKFRERRTSSLQAELDDVSSTESLGTAIGQTALHLLTNRAPKVLLVLLLTWIGVKIVLRILKRATTSLQEKAKGADAARQKTLVSTLSGVINLVVYLLAILIALDQLGFNTTALLGSVAILGLAVSFGAQNLVRDVVNGFFILLENQYAVGDWVEIGGHQGLVQRITIRTTWLLFGKTGDVIAIPNGTISGVRVVSREWGRANCDIGIGYGSDMNHVLAVIEQASQAFHADPRWQPQLLEVPVYFGITELGDSAMNIRIRCRTIPIAHWGVENEMRRRYKEAFDAAGIDIPFPQRVIHKAPEG